MPQPIQFYFDFSSPYGYFASHRIDEIAAKYGREVEWHPILLGAIFKLTGARALPTIPIKGEYSVRDFARTARLFGVPYRYPSVFPINPVAPSRAYYWIADSDPAKAKALARRLFHAYFAEDVDISVAENSLALAAGLGIDRDALALALDDPAVKDRLKREIQQATEHGVFGSPFIIVDGEPFHGSDRLDQVERWLATGGW